MVGVIERDGAVWSNDGLPIEQLKQHLLKTGGVKGFAGAEFAADGASVLCVSATSSFLLRFEAANGPTTFEANAILRDRGLVVLPDLTSTRAVWWSATSSGSKISTHIPFGLMERRHHEASHKILARSLETMTGASFSLETASSFLKGAREIDLVRSGLDDIMRSAYGQISAIWNGRSGIPDLRTAAYSIAISRCADAYSAIGI